MLRRLQAAVAEAYDAGYLGTDIQGSGFDLELIVHAGAGAYICGEETALLDSLEGRRGQPRLRPPFPAVAGLYASPTVVNNVESIASVPPILLNGVDWFRSMGIGEVAGLHAVLAVRPRHHPRAVRGAAGHHAARAARLRRRDPGRTLAEVLDARRLVDAAADRRTPRRATGLRGHGGRRDRCSAPRRCRSSTRPPVWCARCAAGREFYAHESCGKCTPCREGTYWLAQIYERLETGTGTEADIEKLLDIADNINRKVVLRVGRRRGRPDPVVDQVLPRRVLSRICPAAVRSIRTPRR